MTTINNLTIEQMREIVSKAPSNAESYQGGYYFRESPQFMFHNGFHDQWNLTDNDGLYFKAAGFHPVRIDDLRTAIAEYSTDSPDSYGWVGVHYKLGDHIVYKKPWVGNNLVLKIGGDGNQSMSLASASLRQNYIRHATPEEIKAGHRIDDTTDHITDIRNHVSPSTRVVDL